MVPSAVGGGGGCSSRKGGSMRKYGDDLPSPSHRAGHVKENVRYKIGGEVKTVEDVIEVR